MGLQLLDRTKRGCEAVPYRTGSKLRSFWRAFDLVESEGLKFWLSIGRMCEQKGTGDVVFCVFDWRVAKASGLFVTRPYFGLMWMAVDVRLMRLVVGGL